MHRSLHGRGHRLRTGAAVMGQLPGVYGTGTGAGHPLPAAGLPACVDTHSAAARCVDGSLEAGDGRTDLRDSHLDRVALYFFDGRKRAGGISAVPFCCWVSRAGCWGAGLRGGFHRSLPTVILLLAVALAGVGLPRVYQWARATLRVVSRNGVGSSADVTFGSEGLAAIHSRYRGQLPGQGPAGAGGFHSELVPELPGE